MYSVITLAPTSALNLNLNGKYVCMNTLFIWKTSPRQLSSSRPQSSSSWHAMPGSSRFSNDPSLLISKLTFLPNRTRFALPFPKLYSSFDRWSPGARCPVLTSRARCKSIIKSAFDRSQLINQVHQIPIGVALSWTLFDPFLSPVKIYISELFTSVKISGLKASSFKDKFSVIFVCMLAVPHSVRIYFHFQLKDPSNNVQLKGGFIISISDGAMQPLILIHGPRIQGFFYRMTRWSGTR